MELYTYIIKYLKSEIFVSILHRINTLVKNICFNFVTSWVIFSKLLVLNRRVLLLLIKIIQYFDKYKICNFGPTLLFDTVNNLSCNALNVMVWIINTFYIFHLKIFTEIEMNHLIFWHTIINIAELQFCETKKIAILAKIWR